MKDRGNRFLAIYSGVLTVVFAATVLTGAASTGRASFEEIDVQRLNLREPDGTLRYVLSSQARFPGAIFRGEEHPHPRPRAGMLFYSEEGTEVGGLVFGGSRDADGVAQASVSLTFDRYEHDQIVQILGEDRNGRQVAGMQVSDRPDRSIIEDLYELQRIGAMPEAERGALMQERSAQAYYGAGRLFVGRNDGGDATLVLNDAVGKPRMVLKVAPGGQASIEFLDAAGEVTGRLTPETVAR